MIVVATDAPLSAQEGSNRIELQQRQQRFCDRVFERRAGNVVAHRRCALPLFEMALEATEEAVYNSLLGATTVKSRFGTAEAIPIDRCVRSCGSIRATEQPARDTDRPHRRHRTVLRTLERNRALEKRHEWASIQKELIL
jgi:hypothetical protein